MCLNELWQQLVRWVEHAVYHLYVSVLHLKVLFNNEGTVVKQWEYTSCFVCNPLYGCDAAIHCAERECTLVDICCQITHLYDVVLCNLGCHTVGEILKVWRVDTGSLTLQVHLILVLQKCLYCFVCGCKTCVRAVGRECLQDAA